MLRQQQPRAQHLEQVGSAHNACCYALLCHLTSMNDPDGTGAGGQISPCRSVCRVGIY